jgi:WD40 repeat protein
VIYTAGNTLVSYSRIDRRQQHIASSDGCQGITALAVSPNLRYAATAERHERASISVYDLKTMRHRKHFQHTLSSSKQFVCLRFAADNQTLLALTVGPDSMLVCWNWSKAKVLASIQIGTNVDVRSCSFCPTDSTVVCASGTSCLRFYRLATSEFQSMPDSLTRTQAFGGAQFLCHLWLQTPADTLIAV